MSFDPEKVDRPYVKEWGHHAVYMSDYDQLLELYRALLLRSSTEELHNALESFYAKHPVAEQHPQQHENPSTD